MLRPQRTAVGAVAFAIVLAGCSQGSDSTTTTTAPATTTTAIPLATMTTTPKTGMAVGEQIPATALWALVPGNDLDADRINLIVAPWGWEDHADFEVAASAVLSWEGNAFLIGEAGEIVTDPADATWAQLGTFAIEPWRSSRDKFNVWITDVEPETPVAWLNDGEPPFDLPDQSVVTLALHAEVVNPDLTSVAGMDNVFVGPGQPERPLLGNPFANSMVVVPATYPQVGLRSVPHELGHALFNLADEYVGQQQGFDGREDLSSWPSCAETPEEADEWWGDLVGDVDPMAEIWAAEMKEVGFSMGDPADLVFFIEVSNVDGGCYDIDGSVRATFDSLMNDNIPVLGSVNRRWAEQILGLWEGAPRS